MLAGALTLQLFPVARTSFLLATFGIPFERALKFHKKLGLWIWIGMTVHFGGMWITHAMYYHKGEPDLATCTYRTHAFRIRQDSTISLENGKWRF